MIIVSRYYQAEREGNYIRNYIRNYFSRITTKRKKTSEEFFFQSFTNEA